MPDPSKLGHFNLLEEIAHGGMGTVYRAFDPTLNREVAIKVLRRELAHDPKFLNDFLQEARFAAAISHPHIVQIYFVGEEKAQYYIVMELLKGWTLREIIERDGPLPEERALELAIEVVEGLRAAYKNKMIHGDIKPANVFVTDDTGAKVLDFGLSKLANVEVAPTDGIWGSPYYISPERVGQKAEDFRSDVYSLGATLFQALTGHPPFEADTPEELAGKRLNEKPPLLRDVNPSLTRKTEEVVNKMLNKSILLRYRDYDALLEDLRDAKTEATAKRLGVDLHPELQPPPPAPEVVAPKSPLPLVITAVVAVLVIVGILAFFFVRRLPKPIAITTITASFTATPVSGAPPLTVTFTDTSTGLITNRFWNFGDGRSMNTSATNVTHTYAPGAHTVTLVVDGFGGVSTNTREKYIRVSPTANFTGSPVRGNAPLTVVFTDTSTGDIANRFWDFGDDNSTNTTTNTVVTHTYAAGTNTVTLVVNGSCGAGTNIQANYIKALPGVKLYTVEFTITATDAHIVALAGEFNNWAKPTPTPMHKQPNGTWVVTEQLKAGRYEYKFIVDGKWIPDPENPNRVPENYNNSVVVIGQ